MRIAIIGAGAAGCFASIEIKRCLPQAEVTVYESLKRPLAKVAITGGGRCNLTNSFQEVKSLEQVYPRGARLMKRLFHGFDFRDTYTWFESHGVQLVTQSDQCIFPRSQDAMEIVDTLLREMNRYGVQLLTEHRVAEVKVETDERPTTATDEKSGNNRRYKLTFTDRRWKEAEADVVVVTSGGHPRAEGFQSLKSLQLDIIPPVPSLFSLCLPQHPLTELTGTVVEQVGASIPGTKLRAEGPLLITHWGLSGPAILKLSSFAARHLHDLNYHVPVAINWLGSANEHETRTLLESLAAKNPQKQLVHAYPTVLNSRLWAELLRQCGLNPEMRWHELGKKGYNRLCACLTNNTYQVEGKNQFKEEFVTCGGVALTNINAATLECKKHPCLYFAGEVLDLDAVTGGFNLQAAWTTGFTVAQSIIKQAKEQMPA